jgi:hypothetical protein
MLASPPCLFFDKRPMPDFKSLVAECGDGALASPTRSTVPLLALIKDDFPLLDRMLSECVPAASATTGACVHLEYTVKSPRGRGKASHTDAMVLSSGTAVAVETKWTEPRADVVGEFHNLSSNRQKVLEGWLDLLGRGAGSPLKPADFSSAIYQMVHRAASACLLDSAPSLIYLQFHLASEKPEQPTYYFTDLTDLYGLLGKPTGFSFCLIELPIAPALAFQKIAGLKKGLSETDAAVRDALIDTELFGFGEPVICRIG